LVTLPQHPEANQVLGEVALELGIRGVSAAEYMPGIGAGSGGPYTVEALGESVVVDSPLVGAHQHRNLALAMAAAVELGTHHGFPITPGALEDGIRETRWPARLERIQAGGREWILDVAHNPAGAWALRAGLSAVLADETKPRILIFSCLRDKPIAEMAQILFPLFDEVIVAPIHSSRAADPRELLAAAMATGTAGMEAESVSQALQMAAREAKGGTIVVSGSVYLVGEARSLLLLPGGFMEDGVTQ